MRFRPVSIIILVNLLLCCAATPGLAADFTVNTTLDVIVGTCDAAHCSLREAIIAANATVNVDTIYLPAETMHLSIAGIAEDLSATGDLDILEDVYIEGLGADVSVIDANQIDRVFEIHSASMVTFTDLTIRGGGSLGQGDYGGGGIRTYTGTDVHLERCAIVGNRTGMILGLQYYGGGINNWGVMTILDCTISGNIAASGGGGIFCNSTGSLSLVRSTVGGNRTITSDSVGGGVHNLGSVHLVNSTVSGNIVGVNSMGPGGISSQGPITIEGSTISGNTHTALHHGSPSDQLELNNTIIDGPCDIAPATPMVNLGGNLESPGNTCQFGGSDLFNVPDPMLSPLGDHGGPTANHAPLPGSPAIDFPPADPAQQAFDQRQISRPQDGNNSGTAHCDIGAVEVLWGELIPEIFFDGFEEGDTLTWSHSVP